MLVVFSGCSFLFPSFFGGMKALQDRGLSKEDLSFAGTSGGSVAAALFSNGISPEDALDLVKKHPPISLVTCNPYFYQPARHIGLFSLESFKNVLKSYVPRQFASAKFPLTVITTNIDTQEGEYFSTTNTPTADVALAVTASCSIPFLFVPVIAAKGELLSDGGIVNTFAIDLKKGGKDVIGIRALSDENKKLHPVKNRFDYITAVISSMMNESYRKHIEDAEFARVINIELPFNPLDFHLTSEDFDQMYDIGYKTVHKAVITRNLL